MREQFVYAVYDRIEEANKAVQNLTNAGIPVSAISLYADDDVIEEAQNVDTIVELEELDDGDFEGKSFWNRIADFFGGDDDNEENFPVDFSGYEDELDDDKILVAVDKTYEGEALSVDTNVSVMEEHDPNQVETFAHRDDYAEPKADHADLTDETVVITGAAAGADVADDPERLDATENPDIVAGDMGASSAYSHEHQESELEAAPETVEEEPLVTEKADEAYSDNQPVAGDTARESEDAENYYTNIDEYRQEDKPKVVNVAYEKDEESDEKLRQDRKENRVAGDMGDSSDYSEYYHGKEPEQTDQTSDDYHDEDYYLKGEETRANREAEERRQDYSGVADVKRPVTKQPQQQEKYDHDHYNNDQQLGAFEQEMRSHEEVPPADEYGVNPEQFEDN